LLDHACESFSEWRRFSVSSHVMTYFIANGVA
jgi:hypothetical protein